MARTSKRTILFAMQALLARWSRCAIALAPGKTNNNLHLPTNSISSSISWNNNWLPSHSSYSNYYYDYNPTASALFQSRLSSSSTTSSFPNERAQLVHGQLESFGVDADSLLKAALKSLEDPTAGYDKAFGKPAIRAYRAFIYPKKKEDAGKEDAIVISAAAGRTARQIDFLMKRHKSQQTEWVRHHDTIRDRRQVFPLILILDNVRSAFNVGSLYRTADACGCQNVYTCGITPHPDGSGADKLAKSALGAEMLVPSQHFITTQEAIQHLREHHADFEIIGMETTEQSQVYTDVQFNKKIALVLGNEVTGVDTEIMSKLDAIVELPTYGAKNSLNVAACAPVVLYEILRQWKV